MHYNCSRHLRLFVCSVFVPLCSEHVPGAVPACRNLCEIVKTDCQPVLAQFLLPWPAELECSRFPAPPALCMNHPSINSQSNYISHTSHLNKPVIPAGSTQQNPTPALPNGTISNQNVSGGNPISGNLQASKILSWGDGKIPDDMMVMNFTVYDAPKVGFSHCPPRFAQVDETCTPLCGQDAYYRFEDKNYTKTWIIIWSVISCSITSFTLLTFWLDQNRFKYPERPLLFMTLCCFLYSFLVLLRSILGADQVTCNLGYLVTRSSDNTLCAGSAFILHHLELAIRMWWMIFCVCWYLHAACEWSNESLVSMSSLFHAAVYGFSGIPALLALTTGHISADELTGSCAIKEESSLWFVVVPHGLYLILGGIFSFGAGVALIKVKVSLKESGRCVKKLEQLMVRLLVFTILFLLPEVTYLVCTIYESWHRPWWKSLALLSALDCRTCSHEPVYHTASLQVVLLRIVSNLMVVLCCIMWVCSGKTWRTWMKICETPTKSTGQKVMPITRV